MYASVRQYKGVDPSLIEEAKRRRQSLEATMTKAPGFRAWYLVRTSDGLASVTLCEDQAGVEESVMLAAGWIRENTPDMAMNPPAVSNGEVVLQFGG